MKINILPSNDKTNGWNCILEDRTPHGALNGDTNADWLVVGAGFFARPTLLVGEGDDIHIISDLAYILKKSGNTTWQFTAISTSSRPTTN